MTGIEPSYRLARPADAAAVVRLVNAAYRGDTGWTREGDILAGDRTDEAAVLAALSAPDSLILLCHREDELLGCIHVERAGTDEAYLGMLAITPDGQQGGLGKILMGRAETFARERWGVSAVTISVINKRAELIDYYLRRGYAPTGETLPFPFADGLSAARVDGIELVVLKKALK